VDCVTPVTNGTGKANNVRRTCANRVRFAERVETHTLKRVMSVTHVIAIENLQASNAPPIDGKTLAATAAHLDSTGSTDEVVAETAMRILGHMAPNVRSVYGNGIATAATWQRITT
jgi:hypothetical protein